MWYFPVLPAGLAFCYVNLRAYVRRVAFQHPHPLYLLLLTTPNTYTYVRMPSVRRAFPTVLAPIYAFANSAFVNGAFPQTLLVALPQRALLLPLTFYRHDDDNTILSFFSSSRIHHVCLWPACCGLRQMPAFCTFMGFLCVCIHGHLACASDAWMVLGQGAFPQPSPPAVTILPFHAFTSAVVFCETTPFSHPLLPLPVPSIFCILYLSLARHAALPPSALCLVTHGISSSPKHPFPVFCEWWAVSWLVDTYPGYTWFFLLYYAPNNKRNHVCMQCELRFAFVELFLLWFCFLVFYTIYSHHAFFPWEDATFYYTVTWLFPRHAVTPVVCVAACDLFAMPLHTPFPLPVFAPAFNWTTDAYYAYAAPNHRLPYLLLSWRFGRSGLWRGGDVADVPLPEFWRGWHCVRQPFVCCFLAGTFIRPAAAFSSAVVWTGGIYSSTWWAFVVPARAAVVLLRCSPSVARAFPICYTRLVGAPPL